MMGFSGRQTQFYIDVVYGVAFMVGFAALFVYGMDARIAAFEGGLVFGYFLRVWEKMSVYEQILAEEVAEEAEAAVAEEAEEVVPAEVEETVAAEAEAAIAEEVEAQVAEEAADQVAEATEERVPEAVEARVDKELDRVEERVDERIEETTDIDGHVEAEK